ncbi:MAG: hypothetical protein DRP82_03210 [Planctomycetota bacterium]|nr:MAG: hypothetical protein DRP82_03210 [Planctomycetota bacterium]
MRGAIAVLLGVFVVAAFLSVGCSRRSKKHKKEPLQITTTSLPDATEGVTYSYTLSASGGNASNYTWSISGQPSWLSIDPATGELNGTPPAGSASSYTFTVEVTDGRQTASKQFDLVVRAAPLKADFEASPTNGIAPLTVNFTDKSTGNPTSWEWDFDNDGTVDSTDQNPTYTYSSPGWYTVRLTVSDGTSSDSCVKEMYIQVAANVYYVDGVNGDDANSGLDWSDAFATIGKALSVAGDYELVLVADATYNETNLKFDGKKIYLKGVDHNSAGAQPVIDCQGGGRAFYFGSGETGDSVVDNFTIKNGSDNEGGAIYCESSSPTIINCVFSDNSADYGGAVFCKSASSAMVTNCTFSGNDANVGGAVYCSGSSPTITNCTFSDNKASPDGGAICCYSSSNPNIANCTFSGNTAIGGGAIFCNSSSPSVTDCAFSGNEANADGGAICCYASSNPTLTNCTFSSNSAPHGGAIFCNFSSPTLTSCTFSDNNAKEAWGVVSAGGAIYCDNSSDLVITDCVFSGNSTTKYNGGAISCCHSSPTLTNCVFNGNSADEYGGAIYCYSSSPNITNCVFSGNKTVNSDGGAIYSDYSNPTLTNCTFSGNSASVNGGAIYCDCSSALTSNNCILWGDSAGAGGNEIYIYDSHSSCTLNHCCVDNTGYGGQSGSITENNCIYDDPQFVDAANGDYHLKDTSPCIDAGDNSLLPSGANKDLDGNPRIVNGTVDIGAYEYQP